MSHESVPKHAFDHAAAHAIRAAHRRTPPVMPLSDPYAKERYEQRYHSLSRPTRRDEPTVQLRPLSFDDRSANRLRPATFADMIGQDRLKALMARVVANVVASGRPLNHMMITGASGTGKTTIAQVTAHELGRTVYQVKAPVTHAVLHQLQRQCEDRDVVIVDEIHQQVTGDRRGVSQAADPEDFYHIMEDRRLPMEGEMLPFPAVTFVGATTDEGLLPEAFLNRFPLKLTLDPYEWADMGQMAIANAHALGLTITDVAALRLGRASRRIPRQLNTYVRNAEDIMAPGDILDGQLADEVIMDLNGCTWDGLTIDMQRMLLCLLNAKRESKSGTTYQASVNTIATALGHSRDTKAVSLFVEPYLISEGFVLVGHGGRQLTDAGLTRALELI